jgi:hypothetical protein
MPTEPALEVRRYRDLRYTYDARVDALSVFLAEAPVVATRALDAARPSTSAPMASPLGYTSVHLPRSAST